MYYIYEIRNELNGKRYIGYTTQCPPTKRWSAHKRAAKSPITNLYRALHAYGHENFSFRILCEGENHAAGLTIAEPLMIEIFNPEYNMTKGGDGRLGYVMSEETKRKIGQSNKGKNLGKCRPLSEAHKESIRRSHLGIPHKQSRKDAISKANSGKIRTAQQRNARACRWTIVTPTGHTETILNLQDYCRTHHLNIGAMWRVSKNSLPHHKQFTCTKI